MSADLFTTVGDAPVMRSSRRHDTLIDSVDDWRRIAHPAGGDRQWRPGRSACESARAWFRTGARRLTEELATLFEQSPATRNLQIASAVPEHKTKFRDGAFGPRNHDLLLFGVAGGARTVIGIEVKADEALDKPIGARIKAALNAREAGKRTVFPERVDNSSTG